MKKYGIENFIIEKLEECSVEESSEREMFWIDKLNTYKNGYNATLGGEGTVLYDYRKVVDKYLELQNQRETAKALGCSDDVVRRACKEFNISIVPDYIHTAKKLSMKVCQLDKNTEEQISIFNSISEAANYLIDNGLASNKSKSGIRSHISGVCKGKRKSAYGYKWQYID